MRLSQIVNPYITEQPTRESSLPTGHEWNGATVYRSLRRGHRGIWKRGYSMDVCVCVCVYVYHSQAGLSQTAHIWICGMCGLAWDHIVVSVSNLHSTVAFAAELSTYKHLLDYNFGGLTVFMCLTPHIVYTVYCIALVCFCAISDKQILRTYAVITDFKNFNMLSSLYLSILCVHNIDKASDSKINHRLCSGPSHDQQNVP